MPRLALIESSRLQDSYIQTNELKRRCPRESLINRTVRHRVSMSRRKGTDAVWQLPPTHTHTHPPKPDGKLCLQHILTPFHRRYWHRCSFSRKVAKLSFYLQPLGDDGSRAFSDNNVSNNTPYAHALHLLASTQR